MFSIISSYDIEVLISVEHTTPSPHAPDVCCHWLKRSKEIGYWKDWAVGALSEMEKSNTLVKMLRIMSTRFFVAKGCWTELSGSDISKFEIQMR